MIYTLTLNPAIDLLLDVDSLKIGDINTATKSVIKAGGKGINVSFVLKELNRDSVALGFVGGQAGNIIKDELNKKGIGHDFIEVEDNTRINIKINSEKETALNTPSPYISEDNFNKLLNKISTLTNNDIIVMSGSKPASISNEQFEKLLNTIDSNHILAVYDLSKTGLNMCLKHPSLFVKPNIDELNEILNIKNIKEDDLIKIIRKDYLPYCKYFIISCGENGSLLITQDRNYHIKGIQRKVVSTVGAGDSLVAGFLHSIIEKEDPLLAIKEATIVASAGLEKNGLPVYDDIKKLRKLIDNIEYEEVKI